MHIEQSTGGEQRQEQLGAACNSARLFDRSKRRRGTQAASQSVTYVSTGLIAPPKPFPSPTVVIITTLSRVHNGAQLHTSGFVYGIRRTQRSDRRVRFITLRNSLSNVINIAQGRCSMAPEISPTGQLDGRERSGENGATPCRVNG